MTIKEQDAEKKIYEFIELQDAIDDKNNPVKIQKRVAMQSLNELEVQRDSLQSQLDAVKAKIDLINSL